MRGKFLSQPALQQSADRFWIVIGCEDHVNVIRSGGTGAEGLSAARADEWDEIFHEAHLLGGEEDRREIQVCFFAFPAVFVENKHGSSRFVVFAIDGAAGVTVETR